MKRQGEHLALGEGDRTDLPGPVVDVAEQVTVNALQVREVVLAADRPVREFSGTPKRQL